MDIIDLLRKTIEEKSSDLFIAAGKVPYFREYGEVIPFGEEPATTEQIDKFRKDVLLERAEKDFQESGSFDAGLTLEDGLRFRVNFLLQQGQPALVARPVPPGNIDFNQLNLPDTVAELADLRRGLVLIAGTAGSGKSTTMAAILNRVNSKFSRHIVTIEDPIEFVHQDIKSLVTQREVGADTSSFSDALRNVVRESPDAIFLGEMRDLETMQTAVNAALTGHLVVSTVHTTNTIQCLERIINHCPESQRERMADDLAMALEAIIAQRLVPLEKEKGMIPAVEILKATPLVRHLIADRNFGELEETLKRGYEDGMITFNRSLSELCKAGKISVDDGASASTNREEFNLLVQGMESGIETFRSDMIDDDDQKDRINMKRLLHSAIANDASDLLITVGGRPTLRVNGELKPLAVDELKPLDTKRLLFSILTPRQRALFEEQREIDFALTTNINRTKKEKLDHGIPYRFRINGFYQRGHIAMAVRVIPSEIYKPEVLGIPPSVVHLTDKHQGLILITGPTGHGKSTSIASLINRINSLKPCHIITVEDPIEYVHENKMAVVEQREVHADTLSFTNALKYVLRQDPDVILVGEMRDTETMASVLTAAETGHLVFATLHTNDAAQSIDRIIDSFPAHQQNQIRLQLSGALLGIVSQLLIPEKDGKKRVAAFEVLVATSAIRALIREGKTHIIPSTIQTSSRDGMMTMEKSLKELYAGNRISKEDYLRFSTVFQQQDKQA